MHPWLRCPCLAKAAAFKPARCVSAARSKSAMTTTSPPRFRNEVSSLQRATRRVMQEEESSHLHLEQRICSRD